MSIQGPWEPALICGALIWEHIINAIISDDPIRSPQPLSPSMATPPRPLLALSLPGAPCTSKSTPRHVLTLQYFPCYSLLSPLSNLLLLFLNNDARPPGVPHGLPALLGQPLPMQAADCNETHHCQFGQSYTWFLEPGQDLTGVITGSQSG